MAIKNDQWQIQEVFQKIYDYELVLPNFQRGFVWSLSKQANLLKSLIVGLPVGALLILEGKSDAFQKRKLCLKDGLNISKRDKHEYLLDGQQRLSTIASIFSDQYSQEDDWEAIHDSLYGTLRTRWFVKIDGDQNDWFGLRTFNFSGVNHLIDTDLDDYIAVKQVFKYNQNEVFHPNYVTPEGFAKSSALHRRHLVSKYADEMLVPLYEIADPDSKLLYETVVEIANNRAREVKAELQDSGYDVDFIAELLDISDEEAISISNLLREDSAGGHKLLDESLQSRLHSWGASVATFLNGLMKSYLPIIYLYPSEAERAVAIFEAINQGGEPLSVFDLVVAKSAQSIEVGNLADEIFKLLNRPITIHKSLSREFVDYRMQLSEEPIWNPSVLNLTKNNFPSKKVKDWFINVLSLLVHVKHNNESIKLEHIKRDKILALTSKEISDNWKHAIRGVIRALAFVQFRCGITKSSDINYSLMIVVLSFFLVEDDIWNDHYSLDRLEYWWWINIFGGGYQLKQNEVCVNDIVYLQEFLITGKHKYYNQLRKDVFELQNYSEKQLLLRMKEGRKEPAVVSKGLMSFIVRSTPFDWLGIENDEGEYAKISAWQASEEEPKLETHHIIPISHGGSVGESTQELRQQPDHFLNSPFNFTMISNHANRLISNRSAKDYLVVLSKANRRLVNSHFLPVQYEKLLDNSHDFLAARGERLIDEIEKHIDKLV